jgi:predicted CopG family antitoxin
VKRFAAGYVSEDAPSQSVAVLDDLYSKLAERAATEGKSISHVANELLTKAMA